MPNYCSNILTWDASEEVTSSIRAFVSKDLGDGEVCNFSYDAIVPQTPEIIESLSKSTAVYFKEHPNEPQDMSWYEWRLANWGCKWDNENDVDIIDNGVSFDSPWSPPMNVISHLANHFKGVQFTLLYDEPGMAFCGKYIAYCDEDGELSIDSSDYSISDDPVSYMHFQKCDMDNDNLSYNGSSVIDAEFCSTDSLEDFHLLGWCEVDRDSFEPTDFAIEPCEGEDGSLTIHEYYSIESVEWYDDKFTVTALPVDGFDCKHQSLRLDFKYDSDN